MKPDHAATAEDARLRASERRLAEAQLLAGLGSWEWSVGKDEITWSAQLYRNFGVDPHTFQPTFESYMGLVHPEDRERMAELIATALRTHQPFEVEHRVLLPAGPDAPGNGANIRFHHCTGYVEAKDGRVVRMAGTSQDVTERYLAEEKLRQAVQREQETVARLKELDAAKSHFVSSVSHELRTPLTSIIGYLQLFQEDSDGLGEEQKKMLDVVEHNSQRLLSLIEDLLTQSRVESGSFRLALEPTEIGAVVETATESVKLSAAEKGLDFQVWISPDIGLVMGDAVQLERLVLNLLTNAIKFTQEGSVRACVKREEDEVVLAVTDTGVGIPTEELPRTFSPFFRTSNTDRTMPGTGLGLVIVKAIVDQHHGHVDLRSELGRGTTVTVRLPVLKEKTV